MNRRLTPRWPRRVPAIAAGLAIACAAAAPPGPYPDRDHLLVVRDGELRPVRSLDDWRLRRAHILENMMLVMGEPPNQSRRVPLDARVSAVVDCGAYERRRVDFAVEPGDRLPAYLLVPKRLSGKAPAMLCLHQTVAVGKEEPAGLAGSPNLHYAAELAARGYVALAVDYPNFGEYRCDPYALGYASATMKGIWNHRRAVDYLASLDEVDPERIGAIGHSLGGHNALFLAAFDDRVKATVSCCGFCSFRRYKGGDLTGWSHAGYMPRIRERYGADPRRMPFEFAEVLASIAPRAIRVVAPRNDDNFDHQGVVESVAAAREVFAFLDAEDRLEIDSPEAAHDFPAEARARAYAWLDAVLKARP